MYYYCIIFQKGSSLQILESTTDFVVQSLVLRLQKVEFITEETRPFAKKY